MVTVAERQLEESSLGTGERTFEIDRLKPLRPIFQCGAIGLRGLLIGTQGRLGDLGRLKLEPTLPGSVGPLCATNPHHIRSIAYDKLGAMFTDTHTQNVSTGGPKMKCADGRSCGGLAANTAKRRALENERPHNGRFS